MKDISKGWVDIIRSIQMFSIAIFFAWGDTKSRYKRSILGPLWIILTTIVSISGLGYIWSILFKLKPEELVPSLTLGLVTWQFVSATILESSSIFVRYSNFIKNISTPLSFFPLYLILKNLIYFCHAFLVVVLVFIIFQIPFSLNQLLFFPNLFLLIGNLFWIILLFGIIGSKFRDFEQIVSSLMPMFFFLSPIIYKPDQLNFASLLIWLNPFTYMIALIRNPLLNIQPELMVYKVSIISLILGLSLSSFVLGKAKLKIPFWI